MTTLTIDIGNTATKAAVFSDNILVLYKTFKRLSLEEINSINFQFRLSKTIISSVNNKEEARVKNLLKEANIESYSLTNTSSLPIKIDYKTPETLGRDRIAAMLGAYSLNNNKNYLIIDIGTCITYDLITDNHFRGGNITPGIQMRLDSMHDYTASLPKIEFNIPKSELGVTTNQALLNGAYWGIYYEIKSIIYRYKKEYKDLTIIITGGGAKYFTKFPNVIYEPMLVLMGLNFLANNLSK